MHPARRARLIVAAVLVPLVLAAGIGIALTWPDGSTPSSAQVLTDVDVDYPSAVVTATEERRCDGIEEDRLADGTIPDTVPCLRLTAEVTSGTEQGREIQLWAPSAVTDGEVSPGTRIVVQHYPGTDGGTEVWAWHDYQRTLPLVAIALAFALAVVLVAGARGARALVGLALAFVTIGGYVLPALLSDRPALVVALCAATVIMTVVLYLAHGVSLRTSTALLGTLAGLLLTAGLGVIAVRWARLNVASTEDSYRLAQLLGDSGATSLRGIFLCGLVLAGLGVLNDVTITQASAVWELRTASPGASRRELFRGGMRIGRDHIASTVYTIAFAYSGAALPILMLLQLYGLPLWSTLTGGEFAEEIVRTCVSSIGLVLAVPLTTAVAAVVAAVPGAASGRHRVVEHAHAHGGPAPRAEQDGGPAPQADQDGVPASED
ncbi:YibE/F family protein [Cellulomonas fimi]|uniref:YibE/F family protein n=1 Tax=Cellulomonas sp. RIT-PI-Y TaxID=3035297 RepID=UPI0021D90FB1